MTQLLQRHLPLYILLGLVAQPYLAAAQFVDCEPEASCAGMAPCCMVRIGPEDQSQAAYELWRPAFEAWRTRVRAGLEDAAPRGFEAYDESAVQWSRSDWVQAKTMLHDRYLFDRDTNQWTVKRYLEDLTARYGGVDSVVLWQFYPNGGVDDRNQFDMIASLPGGTDAVRSDLVGAFEAAGVKVFWAVFPWDGGTRPSSRPMYEELTELIIESGAHGLNGDTLNGVNVSWWDESVGLGAPLVLEPEWMKTNQAANGQGFFNLAHNVASWGQTWGNDGMTGEDLPFSPQISAYKALEPRHTVHITDRWAMNRTSNLQTAFFNGIGYLAWESVWCNYNQITERSGEELRRIRTIYRGLGQGLLNGYSTWNPHVPVSTVEGVFASQFTSTSEQWTLWTVVNRAGVDVGGDLEAPALELPCQPESRFFDIWMGVEIADFVCSDENSAVLPTVVLETAGYGCVLRSDDGSTPPGDFLDEMAALAARPLSSFDSTWRFLRQNPIVPSLHLGCPSGGCPGPMQMVLIPFNFAWDFRCSSNQIEPFGDQLATAVDVQFAWEPHPMRHHERLSFGNGNIFFDVTKVTNAQYAEFLAESGWRPQTEQNWLKSWDWDGPGEMPTVPQGDENRPVNWVSRYDAEEYCKYYDKRLPESFEWQFVAQGGTQRRFPWGNDEGCQTCAPPQDNTSRETPKPFEVDAFPDGATPNGIFDLWGNIFEWTSAFEDEHSVKAIVRGGHFWRGAGTQWYFPRPNDLFEHNTFLMLSDSMDRSAGIGFRCAANFRSGPSLHTAA